MDSTIGVLRTRCHARRPGRRGWLLLTVFVNAIGERSARVHGQRPEPGTSSGSVHSRSSWGYGGGFIRDVLIGNLPAESLRSPWFVVTVPAGNRGGARRAASRSAAAGPAAACSSTRSRSGCSPSRAWPMRRSSDCPSCRAVLGRDVSAVGGGGPRARCYQGQVPEHPPGGRDRTRSLRCGAPSPTRSSRCGTRRRPPSPASAPSSSRSTWSTTSASGLDRRDRWRPGDVATVGGRPGGVGGHVASLRDDVDGAARRARRRGRRRPGLGPRRAGGDPRRPRGARRALRGGAGHARALRPRAVAPGSRARSRAGARPGTVRAPVAGARRAARTAGRRT